MKLLLDANLSPSLRAGLEEAGFETIHVVDVALQRASDEEIFRYAAESSYVVVTADADFGALLALRRATAPSVLQLRGVAGLAPTVHLSLMVDHLVTVSVDLEAGAIVSLSPTRLAVRRLPV